MPKAITTRVGPRGPGQAGAAGPILPALKAGASYVSDGDKTTHVIIPLAEYRKLLEAEAVREAARILDDPNAEWVDGEEFALQLAGRQITDARKVKGLTQKQLGEKLGLPQSMISRIERSPDRTTVRTLRKIAAALGADVRSLLG